MLHLILGILKVIGITLLVILGFLLAAILALLFVPLRYRVSVKKDSSGDVLSTIQGHAGISWLLRLIGLTVDFVEKQLIIRVKIFGFTLKQFGGQAKPEDGHKKKIGAKRKGVVKQRRMNQSFPDKKTIKEEEKTGRPDQEPSRIQTLGETRVQKDGLPQKESLIEEGGEAQKDGLFKRLLERCLEMVNSVLEFVLSIPEKVLDLFWWCWDLIESGENRVEKLQKKKEELMKKARPFLRDSSKILYQKILLHLKRLWKHYRPRAAKGWIHYGTGAPDITGELTGLVYLVLPAAFDKLELQPDFTESVIEGDVTLKGHIRAIWVIMTAVSLLMDKEFRRLIRVARGRQGGNKDGGQ